MASIRFTDLIVWQKAYALSVRIQKLTEVFPPDARSRLGDQMLRAASSIPTNIAEGFGRWTSKDQAYFYSLAKSSANELKVQLMQSVDFGYCDDVHVEAGLADEVCAMLYRLRQKVLERGSKPAFPPQGEGGGK